MEEFRYFIQNGKSIQIKCDQDLARISTRYAHMIVFNLDRLITGILLVFTGMLLLEYNPFIATFDIVAALWLLWNSINSVEL